MADLSNGIPAWQLRQISQRFDDLARGMRNRMARRGVRRGAAVIRDAVKRGAQALDDPETKESIARNVAVQQSRRLSRNGQVGFRVGIRGGAKKSENKKLSGGDTWYWRFLEFGRGPVSIGKNTRLLADKATGQFFGKKVGAAAPRPFMRPAMAASVVPATAEVTNSINADLDDMFRGVR